MNISRFIARRITFQGSKGFAKIIMNIGTVAVALAVTVMIVSTSLFKGFNDQVSNKVFDFWGHIHISDSNTKRTFEAIPIEHDQDLIDRLQGLGPQTYNSTRSFDWFGYGEEFKAKETRGSIKNISPFIILPAIIDTRKEFEGMYMRGLTKDYDWSRLDNYLKDGRWLNFDDVSSYTEIVLSEYTSKRLDRKVGDKIIVNFILEGRQIPKRMDVVGIYGTGIEEYDKQFAILDMSILQDALDWKEGEVAGYEVILEHAEDMALWNEYIYIEELPSRLYSETIREKFDNIFAWLGLQAINENVIFLLMIIVAIITMITTYLILILERTKTIGILKSLGATNGNVVGIFLYCAAYIISKGMLIGNILGLSLCFLQKQFKFIKLDEANYLIDSAPIAFDLPAIILINVGVLVVTLIFLLIPSLLISRIKPVKILRFN
ncbi:ABC transporter permease [Saprospiraceae bacterium]|nr:ABC transporter permease [Saprospiraceae bacterium]